MKGAWQDAQTLRTPQTIKQGGPIQPEALPTRGVPMIVHPARGHRASSIMQTQLGCPFWVRLSQLQQPIEHL